MKLFSYFLFTLFLILATATETTNAQDLPYTEGSVWDISYIKTKAPYFEDYIKNLSNGWRRVMDEAKKDGLILNYMVLSSSARSPQDWDLMLMIEYKNLAAMDNLEPKMRKIQANLFGSQEEMQTSALARNDIRELIGGRVARELHLK